MAFIKTNKSNFVIIEKENPDIKILYIRMALIKWERCFEMFDPFKVRKIQLTPEGLKSLGFLEVYESMEEMHKEYPDCPYVCIQYKPITNS